MNEEMNENDYRVANRREVAEIKEKLKRKEKLDEVKEGLREDARKYEMNRVRDLLKFMDREFCALTKDMQKVFNDIDSIGRGLDND